MRRTANLHQGGTIHDVTANVNQELCEVAVKAAEAIGIPVTGIDLLVPDVTASDYVFIEANERPGLANHEPQPTAKAFVDYLFPGSPALPQAWTPEESPTRLALPGAGAHHDLGGQLRRGLLGIALAQQIDEPEVAVDVALAGLGDGSRGGRADQAVVFISTGGHCSSRITPA